MTFVQALVGNMTYGIFCKNKIAKKSFDQGVVRIAIFKVSIDQEYLFYVFIVKYTTIIDC